MLKAGVWYLVAHVNDGFRTYRLDRIRRWRLGDGTFQRRADVDLGALWESLSERFEAAILTETITIRLTADGIQRLRLFVSPHAWEAVRPALAETTGPVTVRLPVESIEVGVSELIRLGGDVEILEPEEARSRMASIVAAMAELYLR